MDQYPNGPQQPYPPYGNSQPTIPSQHSQWEQQPPPPPPQKPPKPPWWDAKARQAYYKQYPLSKKQNIAIGCGTLLGVFLLCSICGAIGNASNSTQQPDTAANISSPAIHAHPTQKLMTTPTPSPTPSPTPTPEPTQAPVQQQPAQQLFVTFTGESATVGDATSYIAVHTLPHAALTISVKYCSGHYANSEDLKGTQYADASGDNIWTWDPQTTCRGMATAYVTASLDGQTTSNSTTFTVS